MFPMDDLQLLPASSPSRWIILLCRVCNYRLCHLPGWGAGADGRMFILRVPPAGCLGQQGGQRGRSGESNDGCVQRGGNITPGRELAGTNLSKLSSLLQGEDVPVLPALPAGKGQGCRGRLGGGMAEGQREGWTGRTCRGVSCLAGSLLEASRAGLSWTRLSCHPSEGMCCRTRCPTTSSAVFGAGNRTGAPTLFPVPNPLSQEHLLRKRDGGCLQRQSPSALAPILPRKHPSSWEGDKEGFLQGWIFLCVPIPPLLPVACLLSSSLFPSTELRKRALPSAFPSPFSA